MTEAARIENTAGRPTIVANARTVAEVVHQAHESGLDTVLTNSDNSPQDDGLDRAGLAEILTYCAEQRCGAAGLTCPGCRRDTERMGLTSLDDYLRRFASIHLEHSDLELTGPGDDQLSAPDLAWLSRQWSGEEYWFWARRMLRKLRYGIRQIDDLRPATANEFPPPVVILVEPQIPENIGMVARAMANFGLDELRVVSPRDGWPSEKARSVASGAAAIIDGAALYDNLNDAIADLTWLAATTARQRDMRKPVLDAAAAADEMAVRFGRGERCGILFGRERNGLNSDEIAIADAAVMIPINNRFASLNLAQSVLLLGYEWLKATGTASLGRVTRNERPITPGLNLGTSRKATKEELIGLFEHLEQELEQRGFFNPSHRRHVVVRNIRTMLSRMDATDQEVRTLRGIVATLARAKATG